MFSGKGIPIVNNAHQMIQIMISGTVDQQQRKPSTNNGSNYCDARCYPNHSEILKNIINTAQKQRNQLVVAQTD